MSLPEEALWEEVPEPIPLFEIGIVGTLMGLERLLLFETLAIGLLCLLTFSGKDCTFEDNFTTG